MADTGKEFFRRFLFCALVLLAGYLAYLVLSPFLAPLAWAAVFAMMFYPVQLELTSRIGPNRAALVTTMLASVLIVAPAVMIVSSLARELPQVIDYVQQVSLSAPGQIERIWQAARARIPIPLPEEPMLFVREGVSRALTFLAPRAGAVVADVVATMGSLFVMLFTLFFMLRDGHVLTRHLQDILPLPRNECERLMRDTRDLVVASVGAGLLVAVAQGAIGGVAFWLLGIGAPVFWGVVIGFFSLIPVVGAGLVWVPAVIRLLLIGDISRAVILLIVGVLGISMADNILRPLLLSGRTSVNGLVIFLGLLGGVGAFGFIGLVLGPIILVMTGSLLRIFTRPDLVEVEEAHVLRSDGSAAADRR
jgi:predicted PurR-regulated permease PerM